MDIGFIGLGKMGFPMARRLIEAGHQLAVFDTRKEAVDKLVALGAQAAASPKDIADRCRDRDGEPAVAAGLAGGRNRRRRRDRGQARQALRRSLHRRIAHGGAKSMICWRKSNIVQLDSPVSGGVGGAEKGTLAVMVSGPKRRFRSGKAGARRDRQGVFHRREAGLGADHEARQQFAVGDRHGRDLRGRGDGRQIGPRSRRHDRRHQCRLGHEHREPRQVSARDPAAQLRFRLCHGLDGEGRAACARGNEIAGAVDGSRRSGRPALGSGDPRHGRRSPISPPRSSRSRRPPERPELDDVAVGVGDVQRAAAVGIVERGRPRARIRASAGARSPRRSRHRRCAARSGRARRRAPSRSRPAVARARSAYRFPAITQIASRCVQRRTTGKPSTPA